jgi:hypothetical protein
VRHIGLRPLSRRNGVQFPCHTRRTEPLRRSARSRRRTATPSTVPVRRQS